MAVKVERNGAGEMSQTKWRVNLAETSFKLGLLKLEEPYNQSKMREIITEAGLIVELSGSVSSLVTHDTSYAVDVLDWERQAVKRQRLEVNPDLLQTVEARLKRRGR